ncbi:dienelactone hydrolase family protein [Porphyrobacter sp. GA68]|uniref:dienelactone hydrolase family protein n=1 Tax=Porphyrobacter sp. GA68 TaxID=2883480 RepID=UPI001D196E90|nr:dienelactone hydrolase family protein [Porphyrobacter sp. GA68]
MCEEAMLEKWAKQAISRRGLGMLGAAGALAACTSMSGAGQTSARVQGRRVSVQLVDGVNDAYFTAPAEGRHPGVIIWPDVASLRPVFIQMADRLAAEGFAVLVMNPYYRDVRAPVWPDFAAFVADGGFQKVRPWRAKLTKDAIGQDTREAVAWLGAQDEVDSARGVGVEGYCMGGPFAVWSAAAVPARVKAAASFHGGGLVTDQPTSPHQTFAQSEASYLIAISQDDDAQAPTHKTVLREAADAAGRAARVEVFRADHGWTVPDSPAFQRAEGERAYAMLLELYRGAL